EVNYFVFTGEISNVGYHQKKQIRILFKNGKVSDISRAPDQLNLRALSKPVTKYYICYPKEKH
ncbi:MAG: phosphohydrolase, partial [Flavobacteriaceae bacterium]|nr:phosphohydrolase [Flavobacteriaceae bacterium]